MITLKNATKPLFLLLGFLFYTWLSYQVGANSDNMSSLLVARDLASGNTSLTGWYLSTQSYLFSDIVWTALAIKIFGFSPSLAHIMPAIFYTVFAYLSFRVSSGKRVKNAFFLAPVILVPSFFSVANSIELNIHGGIYLLSMTCIYLISKEKTKAPALTLILFSLICGVVADSDKLILFILVIPCFISSAVQYLLKRQNKDFILALASCLSVISYLIASLTLPLYFNYSVPGIGSQSMASFHEIIDNATLAARGLLCYFSIDYSGNLLVVAVSILKTVLLTAYIILFFVAMVKGFGRTTVDTLLIFSTAVPVGAFIFSKVAIDITSTRFIFFSVISATILIARNIKIEKGYYLVFLLIASVCNVSWVLNKNETEESYYSRLGEFLISNGLTNGYGEFWKASIVTAVSEAKIYPVNTDGSIRPRNWLSREDWYERGGNFFISRDDNEINTAVKQFGPPSKRLSFQSMTILVWDKMSMPPNGISFQSITENSIPLHNYTVDEDGAIHSNGKIGFMLSGPYVRMNKGTYKITMKGHVYAGNPFAEIFSAKKSVSIKLPLKNLGDEKILSTGFQIDKNVEDLELRLYIDENQEVKVYGYEIRK